MKYTIAIATTTRPSATEMMTVASSTVVPGQDSRGQVPLTPRIGTLHLVVARRLFGGLSEIRALCGLLGVIPVGVPMLLVGGSRHRLQVLLALLPVLLLVHDVHSLLVRPAPSVRCDHDHPPRTPDLRA